MTKQEFIYLNGKSVREYNRRSLVAVGIGFLTIFLIILFGVPLMRHLIETDFFDKLLLKRSWFEGAAAALLLIKVFAFRSVRFPGVPCPHCGRPMSFSRLVIITGNCGFCGEKVIHD